MNFNKYFDRLAVVCLTLKPQQLCALIQGAQPTEITKAIKSLGATILPRSLKAYMLQQITSLCLTRESRLLPMNVLMGTAISCICSLHGALRARADQPCESGPPEKIRKPLHCCLVLSS